VGEHNERAAEVPPNFALSERSINGDAAGDLGRSTDGLYLALENEFYDHDVVVERDRPLTPSPGLG